MAKTIAQLRTEAQTIKNATMVGENTATRVGGFGEDIVDYLDTEVNTAFATGEEVENVSVFDKISDISGKTIAQKAEMMPNGNAVSDGIFSTGQNEFDLENVSVSSEATRVSVIKIKYGIRLYTSSSISTITRAFVNPFAPVGGKRYRLTFKYDAGFTCSPALRKADNTYISGIVAEDGTVYSIPIGTGTATWDFIAPADVGILVLPVPSGTASGNMLWMEDIQLLCLEDKVNSVLADFEASSSAEMSAMQADIFNGDNIMTDEIPVSAYEANKAIKISDGTTVTANGCSTVYYQPTLRSSYICVNAPLFNSLTQGLAFYGRLSSSSFISGVAFSDASRMVTSQWMMIPVPYGATYFRYTLRTGVPSSYRYVVKTSDLLTLWQESPCQMIATQIMRSAKAVSDERFIYAFAIAQASIIGSKAYIPYDGNENTVDGDSLGYPNEKVSACVDLFDNSHTTISQTIASTKYSDGTTASPVAVGYITSTPTPNDELAFFALMRFNNNNPYYCYSIDDPDVQAHNFVTCRLTYTAGGTSHDVDFTLNNYRQMLAEMGYIGSYIVSTGDACDNINLHYDKATSKYYAVLCTNQGNSTTNFPLVLMVSSDMATWSPLASLGKSIDGKEIEAIYKDGICYVAYRTNTHGMKYFVRDVTNSTTLSDGDFPLTKELLSKPDCFTFDNEVYMAVNVDPSVYGALLYSQSYYLDARQQIAIFKVVDGVPTLFRTVNNPTGINYFSFVETPPKYATPSSPNPMYAQGAIYLAFSEDKRHLYRRQIAQVSFADVTALFVDFGRVM